jgi:hypothetical protein
MTGQKISTSNYQERYTHTSRRDATWSTGLLVAAVLINGLVYLYSDKAGAVASIDTTSAIAPPASSTMRPVPPINPNKAIH